MAYYDSHGLGALPPPPSYGHDGSPLRYAADQYTYVAAYAPKQSHERAMSPNMSGYPPSVVPLRYDSEEYEDERKTSIIHGEYPEGPRKTKGRHVLAAKSSTGVCCGCCCCIFIVSLLISIIVGHLFTRRHHDWEQPLGINCAASVDFCLWDQGTNIPPNNLTRYLVWNGCANFPGYKDDAKINSCGPPCFDSKLVGGMDTFNNQSGWQYVQFPSKMGVAGQQQLTLSAWWLPANQSFAQESPGGKIPIVVLQHGNNANFNSRMVQTYAYLLRSMGFSVFMPNLRDHGTSAKSSHSTRVTWGFDYYLDLLGAWEYVVADPDSIFGGPRTASQVGIAGMSMGAYVAATVAGLNSDIPGVWLDSGVFDANTGELEDLLRSYGDYIWMGRLTKHLRALTWFFAGWWAGVDIGYKQPSNTLTCESKPTNGIPQKVALLSNSKDSFVFPSETQKLNRQLGEYPDCYQVIESWEASSECSGTHCSMIFQFPEVYRRKACQFWSNVFSRSEAVCRLSSLPHFTPVASVEEVQSQGSSAGSSSGSLSSMSGSDSSASMSDSLRSGSSGSLASWRR